MGWDRDGGHTSEVPFLALAAEQLLTPRAALQSNKKLYSLCKSQTSEYFCRSAGEVFAVGSAMFPAPTPCPRVLPELHGIFPSMQLRGIQLTSVTPPLSRQEASKQNPIHSVKPGAACDAGSCV